MNDKNFMQLMTIMTNKQQRVLEVSRTTHNPTLNSSNPDTETLRIKHRD